MAVVTNKPVAVSGYMLDQLHLSRYFALVIGGDSLPNKKPHPEPVENACRTLGIAAGKRVLVVGDSPNDILSGRAAGARTCGVRSNIGDPKILANSRPDFLINNVVKLMRLFQ